MKRQANSARTLWWLRPRAAVLFLAVPLLLCAYLLPESTYLTLYDSGKYVDANFLVLGVIVYAGFVAGSFFAVGAGSRPQEKDILLYCRWFIWPLFALTIFGYLTWFANAIVQAGGFDPIFSVFYDFFFRPRAETSDFVKYELFPNIPGVTTFTQFGILYATVEALLWTRGEPRRAILLRFATIFSLTLSRAVLLSERLALVEIAIPIIIILVGSARLVGVQRVLVRLAPLYVGFGVFGLFAFAEYFRSWNFYRPIYNGPYLEFAFQRFLGYYVTAINNSALYYYREPLQPLRNTLQSLFVVPGLGPYAEEAYTSILGVEGTNYEQLLETYANPEFTNIAWVGTILNEYSAFLAPLIACFIGVLSASLYVNFVKGRLIGALLYPSWFVGLLEISRVYYWTNQRYFPVLAFLVLSLLLFKFAKVPAPAKPASASIRLRRSREGLGSGSRAPAEARTPGLPRDRRTEA